MTKARIGVYGLGTMGSALALNMAEHGFEVAVTNRDPAWIADFVTEAGALAGRLHPRDDLAGFVQAIARPRAILFMIPSGRPMDAMLEKIVPLLDQGDTVIDGGNANFHDTRRRSAELAERGLHFVGLGVSGGEAGARFGPSMMFGGTAQSWERLRPVLTAIAAKYQGDPCVDLLGPDGAGHFVKTVHNGIEYADMQLIAEVYGLLRDGGRQKPPEIGKMFEKWNSGRLKSYLLEISGKILTSSDPETGKPMVDVIVDAAGQKGTGRWTAIEALALGRSVTTIEAAVAARSWSAARETRALGERLFPPRPVAEAPPLAVDDLENALLAARILAYAQGFSLLEAASDEYGWSLDLARIAEIWRAGCIIRSAMLDDMAGAIRDGLPQGVLFFAPAFRDDLERTLISLRRLVAHGATNGLPVPAFAAALAFLDSMTRARGTTNLIQAQRDFFGAHGFARLDDGSTGQHGPWAQG